MLFEVQVGCKPGIFSFFPLLGLTVDRFMALFYCFCVENTVCRQWERIWKEIFLYHREILINLLMLSNFLPGSVRFEARSWFC